MIGLLVISVLCFLGVCGKMVQTDSLDPSEGEYPILSGVVAVFAYLALMIIGAVVELFISVAGAIVSWASVKLAYNKVIKAVSVAFLVFYFFVSILCAGCVIIVLTI